MTNRETMLRNRLMPAMLWVFALSVPLSAICGEEIDQTLTMSPDGLVAVENVAGKVEIEAWDRDEVRVRGEAGKRVERVEVNATSSGVEVRVINRKGDHRVDGTELNLRVPQGASIEVETISADITLTGSRGESVILRTVSGDLEVDANAQRINLHSVSGDVEFEGTVSRSSFETVSGEITVVGATGEISANTVSGDVTLEAGELTQGRFEAVSGDLMLSLALADGGRLACDSMSGDIRLKLPASQQAEFTSQSFSGSIHTDFGDSVGVSKGPGIMLEHREGDNGAKIRLESFSGDIAIRSR